MKIKRISLIAITYCAPIRNHFVSCSFYYNLHTFPQEEEIIPDVKCIKPAESNFMGYETIVFSLLDCCFIYIFFTFLSFPICRYFWDTFKDSQLFEMYISYRVYQLLMPKIINTFLCFKKFYRTMWFVSHVWLLCWGFVTHFPSNLLVNWRSQWGLWSGARVCQWRHGEANWINCQVIHNCRRPLHPSGHS